MRPSVNQDLEVIIKPEIIANTAEGLAMQMGLTKSSRKDSLFASPTSQCAILILQNFDICNQRLAYERLPKPT